jgi:hypothetical protein
MGEDLKKLACTTNKEGECISKDCEPGTVEKIGTDASVIRKSVCPLCMYADSRLLSICRLLIALLVNTVP